MLQICLFLMGYLDITYLDVLHPPINKAIYGIIISQLRIQVIFSLLLNFSVFKEKVLCILLHHKCTERENILLEYSRYKNENYLFYI